MALIASARVVYSIWYSLNFCFTCFSFACGGCVSGPGAGFDVVHVVGGGGGDDDDDVVFVGVVVIVCCCCCCCWAALDVCREGCHVCDAVCPSLGPRVFFARTHVCMFVHDTRRRGVFTHTYTQPLYSNTLTQPLGHAQTQSEGRETGATRHSETRQTATSSTRRARYDTTQREHKTRASPARSFPISAPRRRLLDKSSMPT